MDSERYADEGYRVELEFEELNQEPLTLALSRRERGLIEWFGRSTPTWDIELNSSFEKPTNRPPLPRERAGVRGESNEDQKIAAFGSSYTG